MISDYIKSTRYAQNFLHCRYERTASGGKSGSSPDDASVTSRVAKAFCGFDSSMEEAMHSSKEASIICLRDTDSLFVIANEDDDIESLWRRLFNNTAVKEGWNANIPPDIEERMVVNIAMFFMVGIINAKCNPSLGEDTKSGILPLFSRPHLESIASK